MKILLISAFFPPEVGSAAHLFYELGQALRHRGHEITVLTGLPRYHVIGDKQRQYPFIHEEYHGLQVLRVFNLDVPWAQPLLRGLDQLVFAFFAGVAGFSLPRFDAAVVYSPPLPLALAAWALGRWRRRPVVVNIQDLFPQSAIDLGVLRNPHLIRVFRRMESFLYRRADLITAHSEGNRRYIVNAGADANRVRVIPNWIDTEAIKPMGRHNGLRAGLGLGEKFIVSFAGIMGFSQDLEIVLESAELLKNQRDIAFLMVGDGVEKPKLEKLARDHHLDNVYFLPMQPKDKYPEVLAASDVCLATLRREVRTPVVPSKILSIMAAGRPVLASLPLDGDAPQLIAAAQCGISIAPGDPQAMAQAILQFYRDREPGEAMGARGREFVVRHFSLEHCAIILESYIKQVCQADRPLMRSHVPGI
ncbi:MAG: glycosyltransferase family 4 protein [Deltaproteobacteria bacterium]|nr:glycosyltransferase family 4 protein [Deltaproteobacteria bacterium]